MASPFFSAYDTISTPNGTWIKPGGQVVAYVRSTGAQNGDLPEVVVNMVATIAAGVARCRAGFNDIVMVLPGHTENVTTTLFTPVSGAQIIGAGMPGAANAPNVTLTATAATLALSAANMTLAGLNINSATAAVTGAIVITGSGVTLANNFIRFTGALAANVPIQVTGAANCVIADNDIAVDSTAAVIGVTLNTTTNLRILRNFIRQIQATSGGNCISFANTLLISGMVANNFFKTATDGTLANLFCGATPGTNVVATVGLFENYVSDGSATGLSGILSPVAAT